MRLQIGKKRDILKLFSIKHIPALVGLILTASAAFSQPLNSIYLKKTKQFCSQQTDFPIIELQTQPKDEVCFNPRYGNYFTFGAKTNSISIELKSDVKGAGLALFIWGKEDGLKMIKCAASKFLCSNNLALKTNYIIGVFIKTSSGKFGLCVDSEELSDEDCPPENQVKPEFKFLMKGTVYDQNGKLLENHKVNISANEPESFITDVAGGFEYKLLESSLAKPLEMKSATDVKLDIQAFVYDSENQIIKSLKQDEFGKFVLQDLNPNKEPIISISTREIVPEKDKIALAGRLVEKNDLSRGIEGEVVSLINNERKVLGSTRTNERGDFNFSNLIPSRNYNVSFDNQEAYAEVIIVDDQLKTLMRANSNLKDENGGFVFKELPYMKTRLNLFEVEDNKMDFSALTNGGTIVLSNIQFESGKFDLLPSSYNQLDKLAEYLQNESNKNIKVSGYTDNKGNKEQNKLLSEKRVSSIINYLTEKGVSKERMTGVGRGQENPIGDNKTEEGRRKNRRVEIELN
ncbi:MAG: OmpA family protein [Flavobacteriales bacterium]|nr:OmpA family protein [Flavobacteriales bacterium]